MRVFMTGGYGCIGAWITRLLLDRNLDVWIYDLKEDTSRLDMLVRPEEKARVHFLQGDVAEAKQVHQAIEWVDATHVLHLAGLQVPVCRDNPILGARVNVLGTLAIFEAARALKDKIQRVVYASSAAVHGPAQPGEPAVSDLARLAPSTHYGAFKVCNEQNARVYWLDHGIHSVGLRPWTVYGVGRDFGVTSEPTKAIKSVAVGRPYHISYGGVQDLQYVRDIAEIFLLCLNRPFEGADAFNIRGAVVPIEQFTSVLAEVVPQARSLVTHGDRQLPIAPDLDDSRLETAFGPLPRTPLAEGVRDTFDRFAALWAEQRLSLSDLN